MNEFKQKKSNSIKQKVANYLNEQQIKFQTLQDDDKWTFYETK